MSNYTGSEKAAEELLRAYNEGKSVEELNMMLEVEESGEEKNPYVHRADENNLPFSDEPEDSDGDAYREETLEEKNNEKESTPFKVFKTQEDYQKDFDRHFNSRFRKNKEAEEKKTEEFNNFKAQVAEFLGTTPERVLEEIESRSLRIKAETEGLDPDQLIKDTRATKEIERLREELAERDRKTKADRAIDDIIRQGAEISREFPGFNLDKAMEDEVFRSTVFSLYEISPESAVKKAFLACEGMGAVSQKETSANGMRQISEGAARPRVTTPVKKVNIDNFSDKEILDFERKILNGEKVNIT